MISDGHGAAPDEERPEGELRERFADEVVLITGFPGYRARSLVQLLAEREPSAVLWLIVPPGELESAARALAATPIPDARLRLIPGEPCAIDFGLSRQTYAELCARVDRWFALYQTTEPRASRELAYRVNLGSAREIGELSRVAENLANVTFLSSAIVFGDRPGAMREEELAIGQTFSTPAAESLAIAEQLLARKLAEAPISIVRTPQVLGARVKGHGVRATGLHRLLALIAAAPTESLALPPGSARLVQALPADFVAEALYAVSALGTRGRTYHFADPDPPTLAQVLELSAGHFGKRLEPGAGALGRLLLTSPGFWLSPQSARALSEWAEGPELITRGGERLLERANLRAPRLLDYLDTVLGDTELLERERRLDGSRATAPFEVVA